MEDLLYLVHRIPYPPNKGDKIRSYHLLKYLSRRYRVHLGTFIDDPNDWQYVDTVKAMCATSHFATLEPMMARVRSVRGFLTRQALSLEYYRNSGLQSWVDETRARHAIDRALVFSSAMAQFVTSLSLKRRVIDFVDVDSDKWHQYAESKSWPMSAVYARESRELLRYERKIAHLFDASLFVSPAEAELFRKLAPEASSKIGSFSNGVDTNYFSPEREYTSPYEGKQKVLVFAGAMDYWPNIDAVEWFAREIFPAVRQQHHDAAFYIVGSRPAPQVQALGKLPGVIVTGSVPDIRPYVAHADVSVAPLRIARGIQNKVLEAMAMGKVTVVSPEALEGINARPGTHLLLARSGEEFSTTVRSSLASPDQGMGTAARKLVMDAYSWDSHLAGVDKLLQLHSLPSSPALREVT